MFSHEPHEDEYCCVDYSFGNFPWWKNNNTTGGRLYFKNKSLAVAMCDLIYKMGGCACALSGIYEYSPVTKIWENMAY